MNSEKKLALSYMTISFIFAMILIVLMLPSAKLSIEDSKRIDTPQSIENFNQTINMGPDYGELSIIDLMGFYIENPPKKGDQINSTPKRHFGGC